MPEVDLIKGIFTIKPLAISNEKVNKIMLKAQVKINGGAYNREITKPFNEPNKKPINMIITMQIGIGTFIFIRKAYMTLVNVKIPMEERSTPPVAKTIPAPIATIQYGSPNVKIYSMIFSNLFRNECLLKRNKMRNISKKSEWAI